MSIPCFKAPHYYDARMLHTQNIWVKVEFEFVLLQRQPTVTIDCYETEYFGNECVNDRWLFKGSTSWY